MDIQLTATMLRVFQIFMLCCCCLVITAHIHHEDGRKQQQICRDRKDYFRPTDFRVSTCAMCLMYLFPTNQVFRMFVLNDTAVLVKVINNEVSLKPITRVGKTFTTKGDSTQLFSHEARLPLTTVPPVHAAPTVIVIKPDVEDEASLQDVINELTESEQARWLQCCHAAHDCCKRQLKRVKADRVSESVDDTERLDSTCPMTWDGYSCVDATDAGTVAHIKCPTFISKYSISPQARATRTCQGNATWWVSSESHMEWTDYSKCVTMDVQSLETELLIGIVCNGFSILLLIPAILVFLMVRPLRSQQRIRLHTCLFVTLLLSSVVGILWERLAMYDMLVTPVLEHFVHTAPNACKFLNIASRLTKTSTFFWMFCEGFQLHWLMVRSLKPIKTMLVYYLIGWGAPIFLTIVYALVRIFNADDDPCWLVTVENLEWLVDAPTIACIALNVIFLATIVKTLLSQLSTQPDDMGSIKRAVRAMFILIPLFGLQQFCILYRPHVSQPGYFVYAVVSALIVNLQGAVVALIFCFFNTEVQTHIKEIIRRIRLKFSMGRSRRQSTISITLHTITQRRSIASLDVGFVGKRNRSVKTTPMSVVNDVEDCLEEGRQNTEFSENSEVRLPHCEDQLECFTDEVDSSPCEDRINCRKDQVDHNIIPFDEQQDGIFDSEYQQGEYAKRNTEFRPSTTDENKNQRNTSGPKIFVTGDNDSSIDTNHQKQYVTNVFNISDAPTVQNKADSMACFSRHLHHPTDFLQGDKKNFNTLKHNPHTQYIEDDECFYAIKTDTRPRESGNQKSENHDVETTSVHRSRLGSTGTQMEQDACENLQSESIKYLHTNNLKFKTGHPAVQADTGHCEILDAPDNLLNGQTQEITQPSTHRRCAGSGRLDAGEYLDCFPTVPSEQGLLRSFTHSDVLKTEQDQPMRASASSVPSSLDIGGDIIRGQRDKINMGFVGDEKC